MHTLNGDPVRLPASLLTLLSLVTVTPSAAQRRFYVDGALSSTRLSSPIARPGADQPTVGALAAGYVIARGVGIELRRSGLQAESASPATMEPYTIGLRASVTELDVTYRPVSLWRGRLTPAVSVGIAQAGLTDYWIADTPREEMRLHARGVTAAAMVDVRVVRHVSLLARVGTQRLTADRGRVGAAFGLNATTVGAGLRLWL